nr:MAG TPA: hypothetical protein [Siphoviridae sp. ctHdl3]
MRLKPEHLLKKSIDSICKISLHSVKLGHRPTFPAESSHTV